MGTIIQQIMVPIRATLKDPNASEKSPDISTISKNNTSIFENSMYTSPSALPMLEMHYSRQNGLSPLSN
jgi:hypothetical protein